MQVKIREKEGIVIFDLEGKIISGDSIKLKRLIDEQITLSGDTPKLLFNFAKVSMLDSSGLGAVIVAHLSTRRKRGRAGTIHVGTSIRNLFEMSKSITVLEHFDSEEQAIESLR